MTEIIKNKNKISMKKFLLATMIVAFALSQSSCVSTKKIKYFQGADSVYAQAQRIQQMYEMRIKPADQIMVKVHCSEPELLEVFANDVTMGTASRSGVSSIGSSMSNSVGSYYGYTVTNEGTVILPALGEIYVMGLTIEECARLIEKKIQEKNLIRDPGVTVTFLNARVTVVGAVKTPRVVNLTSERNTVIDVLAQCGDLDDTGLPKTLKVFRENNGERVMYDLDLTNVSVFESPAYYMQQNDLVYVEFNKSKNIKKSSFYTFLGAGASVLALVSSIVALVYTIKK